MPEREPAPGPETSVSFHEERRAYVRVASNLVSRCRSPGRLLDAGWLGKVRDLSAGGAGLLLRHRFRPGTPLTIELRESTGKLRHTVQARVVHVTAVIVEGDPYWLVGCAFNQPLSDEEFRSLQ